MNKRNRLIVLVLLFSLIFSLAAFAEEGRFVKVTAYDVNIRSGAGTETAVVGTADFGESYEVISASNDWYQVRLDKGRSGWIHASLVKEGARFASSNPTIQVVEAKEASVNVRGGASTSYEIVTTISPGTLYPLLQQSGDWMQIRLPDERTGWVASWLVTPSEDKAKSAAKTQQHQATVIAQQLNVRAAPSLEAKVLGTLQQNEIVPVHGEKAGGWTEISYAGGTGYVATEYLRLPGHALPQAESRPSDSNAVQVKLNEHANLRTGPGTNFPVLTAGRAGSQFAVTAKSGAWLQLQIDPETKAWVAAWLTDVTGDLGQVPEEQATLDNRLRGKTIVLDAGHGGFDVGAVGRQTGVYEKDLNLNLTRSLYNKLVTTGARVVLTRDDDRFVTLSERVQIAEQEQADLFVSLHYNTHDDAALSGSMTFYYSEDGADHALARRAQQALVKTLGLPDLGARYGDYYVLRENRVTAILVETAFLTNAQDELNTQEPGHGEKAAEGLFQAIVGYLQEQ
ncbi:N-acetylmuramoyl-L-alanine amidase [Tumebacillus sp. BK434]|uniref:SH3 domain-containing protein n=1 Tax=Tumebacillus sp. BK434 TaxID=2512169 RepID=UPI001052CDE6|nr:SH3 domain-containing protein [Tumebacillus sp. BK434]TCP54536.1 N-acetylmuramoyl-L-alanine amidase [Tumebacillus sp. BK434]